MSYNDSFNEYMLLNRSIIIALFVQYSKRQWDDIDKSNNWSPVNIGKHSNCDILSQPSDLIAIYNNLIETWFIKKYEINIAPQFKIKGNIESTIITKNNLQDWYQSASKINSWAYDFEILTENEDYMILSELIDEYRGLWLKPSIKFQRWRFLSPKNQRLHVDKQMRLLKDKYDSITINLTRNKIWEPFIYDNYQEYDIDLLWVVLYLLDLWNIQINNITLSATLVFEITINSFLSENGIICIWTKITYNSDSQRLDFYWKSRVLDNNKPQHILLIILLENKNKFCDDTFINEEFLKKWYNIKEKNKWEGISYNINQFFRNIKKDQNPLNEVKNNINHLAWKGYKIS